MGQVVAAHNDCGAVFLVVFLQDVLGKVLAAWVKEVERLVENDDVGIVYQCTDDANLLLVACRQIAYELAVVEQFTIGKCLKRL